MPLTYNKVTQLQRKEGTRKKPSSMSPKASNVRTKHNIPSIYSWVHRVQGLILSEIHSVILILTVYIYIFTSTCFVYFLSFSQNPKTLRYCWLSNTFPSFGFENNSCWTRYSPETDFYRNYWWVVSALARSITTPGSLGWFTIHQFGSSSKRQQTN